MINESIEWADQIHPKYMILHSEYGSMAAAKEVLEDIYDKRIVIENMPKVGLNNEKMIGHSPSQIQELTKERFGLCLDLGHAAKAAVSQGIGYKEYINDFLALKPKMFHICDGLLNNEKDEHMNIGEGEYDFRYLLNIMGKNESQFVTVETPRANHNSLDEDVLNVKRLRHYL